MRTLLGTLMLVLACSAAMAGPEEDTPKRDRIYRAMALIEELHRCPE